jgi:hypothetical protein
MEGSFVWQMPKSDVIVAWKSHATLRRKARGDSIFDGIIQEIASYVDTLPEMIDCVLHDPNLFRAETRIARIGGLRLEAKLHASLVWDPGTAQSCAVKKVAVTQRVSIIPEYGERRDCLDQAWPRFLATAD